MNIEQWLKEADAGDVCLVDDPHDTVALLCMEPGGFLFLNLTSGHSELFSRSTVFTSNLLTSDDTVTPAEIVVKQHDTPVMVSAPPGWFGNR